MSRARRPALTPEELRVLCEQKALPLWCGAEAAVLLQLRLQRRWSQEVLAGLSKVSTR